MTPEQATNIIKLRIKAEGDLSFEAKIFDKLQQKFIIIQENNSKHTFDTYYIKEPTLNELNQSFDELLQAFSVVYGGKDKHICICRSLPKVCVNSTGHVILRFRARFLPVLPHV